MIEHKQEELSAKISANCQSDVAFRQQTSVHFKDVSDTIASTFDSLRLDTDARLASLTTSLRTAMDASGATLDSQVDQLSTSLNNHVDTAAALESKYSLLSARLDALSSTLASSVAAAVAAAQSQPAQVDIADPLVSDARAESVNLSGDSAPPHALMVDIADSSTHLTEHVSEVTSSTSSSGTDFPSSHIFCPRPSECR